MGEITKIFGTHDQNTLDQLNQVALTAEKTALMADGHLGYVMPIGGVSAYENKVSVVGVGYDIACGNAAIRTNKKLSSLGEGASLTKELQLIADGIVGAISFGVGRSNKADDAPTDDPLFSDKAWDALPSHNMASLKSKAREQLGTIGSGNHYVNVFVDENDNLWVGVHFGSRGFGHTVASGFMALGQGEQWGTKVPEKETIFDLNTELGQRYWDLLHLAGKYAYAGREWVARKVIEILGAKEEELIHNHHNFAWKETHGGTEYVVVRKGATPAFPNQFGFVGGSMGDDAVILRGKATNNEDILNLQRAALYSTVHGAGRVMSRTEAKGKTNKRGEVKKVAKVTREMMHNWIREKGVIVRGGGVDESPHVYRRLPDVLAAQGDTVEVVHTLRPLIVAMAGENEFDPYKD